MKQVYKCDYCSKMGTEEEIREHEQNCTENYNMRSCYTCKNRGRILTEGSKTKYECTKGTDIPAGCIMKDCELYERKEKSATPYDVLVRSMFGGGW